MRADHYTRHARVHGTKEGSSNGMRVETHLRKHDDICNPRGVDLYTSAPKSTAEQDGNIEFAVKGVVNSLVNAVVGILDGDGEATRDDDDEEEEEKGSKNVHSGMMSLDEREELENELIRDKNIFEKNLAEGEVVLDTIASGRTSEEPLSRKHKFCLDLYRKHRQSVDTNAAVLKPWQKLLMTELVKPHARSVVWVIGRGGNEGKTWLQNYIESLYGYERVARLDIGGRGSDLLHAL